MRVDKDGKEREGLLISAFACKAYPRACPGNHGGIDRPSWPHLTNDGDECDGACLVAVVGGADRSCQHGF